LFVWFSHQREPGNAIFIFVLFCRHTANTSITAYPVSGEVQFLLKLIVGIPGMRAFDNLKSCFKAQSSKLERLFSLKRGKRDFRASNLSFQL